MTSAARSVRVRFGSKKARWEVAKCGRYSARSRASWPVARLDEHGRMNINRDNEKKNRRTMYGKIQNWPWTRRKPDIASENGQSLEVDGKHNDDVRHGPRDDHLL